MSMPILSTKLYTPQPRPNLVRRPRLIERLNEGLQRKLILISASAGFGKTTLVSTWIAACERPAAWLSLDAADNDPNRFLAYFIAALQTIAEKIGASDLGSSVLQMLQSPQPPSIESMLTTLLNEISRLPESFILILDDYHLIDAKPIDHVLTFLLEHLPPQMHLVITTREDPNLPLARYRAQGQLSELRVTDLRFTPAEAADFLNRMMGLNLSATEISALETRTEGWIAGLQLAAISMQGQQGAGQQDVADFIKSFTGSHRFVMDYLVEEVLQQQPERVQSFLLRTSILDRLCGPLCDAVLRNASATGQATLEALEQANLFIVSLDNERRWYRYHHLFADLLRQRLHQGRVVDAADCPAEYHKRASAWYEEHGLELDAFHHATAANDIGRAERLIEGGGMPLHFRGAVVPILNWLASLPATVLDAWPSLWTTYASTLLVTGQTSSAEEKLHAAETALQKSMANGEADDKTRDLIGRVAAIRATAAAAQQQVETIITQSRRALDYLHPDNRAFRTSTAWKLGYAYHLQGDRAAASQAYNQVIAAGQASGNTLFTALATIGLGALQWKENQLLLAAETYQHALQLFGDHLLPVASEAHLGLARIYYQWNDLAAAYQHGQQSIHLAEQKENNDTLVSCKVFLARLTHARGDVAEAETLLAQAEEFAHQHNFVHRLAEVVATQVRFLLHQQRLTEAAQLAQTHNLPMSQARVLLAQGDPSAALALLAPWRQQVEAKRWADEILNVLVLQAVAHQANEQQDQAMQLLGDALAMAAPGNIIRTFVDEGLPMAHLVKAAADRGMSTRRTSKLLAALSAEEAPRAEESARSVQSLRAPRANDNAPLIEPLSQREQEILQLIAAGQKNQEIADELFISLNTVRYHTKNLYGKLGVNRRTQAVATAQELGIL